MDEETAKIIVLLIYKLSCLLVGTLFCYFGYRLFKDGIWGSAGDMESNFSNNKVILKNAAPGTFFTVLGAAIIIFTVWQGMHIPANFSYRQDVGPMPELREPKGD